MHLNEFELHLTERAELGSSAARKLRAQNKALVAIYGPDFAAKSAIIDADVLKKAVASKTLFNKFTTLHIGKEKVVAVAKVVQLHPVTDNILHIDFQTIKKGQEVTMNVPVRFLNKEACEAIKLGGLLNTVCSYIELKAKAEDMPAYLDCDLSSAQIGISLKVDALNVPSGVKVSKHFESKVIATILAARKKGGDTEEAATAAAEPATAA